MSERLHDQAAPGPEQDPGQQQPPIGEAVPPQADGEHSRLASIRDMVKEAVAWTAPVVGTAIKDETGVDPFRFTKEGQPELTSDQNFATGVARFALRRGVERLAARAGYAA